MDHSPSIITQVTRDEEENATCREEGEFGKKFTELFKLRMTMSARDEAAGRPRRHGVTNVNGRLREAALMPSSSSSSAQTFAPLNDFVVNVSTRFECQPSFTFKEASQQRSSPQSLLLSMSQRIGATSSQKQRPPLGRRKWDFVKKAADLTSPSKGSAEPGMEVLVEYTEQGVVSREMDPSMLCVEHCNMNGIETESCTYCNGHSEGFEQYSGGDGFFESDQIVDECETSGLSQPFDERAQHCECFKPCESSEHCANHSLTSKCSPCCEHCAEHLQLFQQCKPSDQQFDFEPDQLAVNCDSLGQCESTDDLQQYEPSDQQCECFESELDTSTEDSEPCETPGFTPNLSDSMDLLNCGTEDCEYDEVQSQTECSDADEESYPPEQEDEQHETELTDEESCQLSEEVNSSHFNPPAHVYFDESEDVHVEGDWCETQQLAEDMSTDECGTDYSDTCQDYESTQQCATSELCNSDKSSEFCAEEDGSSDCSSIETKSFKTCPDDSIPSDLCSDSSGESDKGAQEDSSDDQTQWESFEEYEEIEQSHINGSNEDKKKTPTA
ncbi:hypothetical protein GBF38_018117, partial [Nibea albiflora]